MWQSTALLMRFFVILCSASKLEHFTNIFDEKLAPVEFDGVKQLQFFNGQDLNQAADGCSELCYKAPQGPMHHACFLFNTRASSLDASSLPTGFVTKAMYGLSEKNHIEPLEKRFSYDNGVKNLETGYFPRFRAIPIVILAASIEAMNSKPATTIDFDKWVSSKDISQSRRMPFEVQEFTGWRIKETVKAWEKSLDFDNQEPTNYFDTLLLTFLDIFCPLLQEGITTIYDPIKKIVFITKGDLSILVVSYGPGDFAVVQSKDNFHWSKGNPLVYLSNSRRWERDSPGNPVQLFEQATGQLFSEPFYKDILVYTQNEVMTILLNVLNIVLMSLSIDYLPEFNPDYNSNLLMGPLFIFYHDLITAVLSSVYKNYEHPVYMTLKTMQTRNFYGDISISTLHKSE